MATYEYVCTSCGRHTEAVQRFSDAPLTECPHCGGTLKRVFHPVGIVLKGSGFYSTDNRGRSKAATKEPEKSESKSDTKSDVNTKSDTKPDAGSKPAASSSGSSTDKS
jgi:putative FmdB family regulatory protein